MADLQRAATSMPVSIIDHISGNEATVYSFGYLAMLSSLKLDRSLQTYSACVANLAPPATPTDMVTITGSATAIVRVNRIILSPTQTTAGINTFFLVKRSAANSGGTSSVATNVPRDSTNTAPTAVVRSYTANPTLGTLVGAVSNVKVLTPALASLSSPSYVFDFVDSGIDQAVVLRGTGDVLALNFNSAALPSGLNISCVVEWSEQ